MNCPKCKSDNKTKDGIIKSRQRYKCNLCNYRFTVAYQGISDNIKKYALHLYLEGLGFRSICRFLNVSHVSVYNWIKSFGEKVAEIRSEEAIEVIEMDEMHSYIGSKKTTVGYGLLLIGMGSGSLTTKLAIVGHLQD